MTLSSLLSYRVLIPEGNTLIMLPGTVGKLAITLLLHLIMIVNDASASDDFDLVITNATIIDAASGARPKHSVAIKDGQIIKVVPGLINDGKSGIDARDMYLIPGLWDMHVHIVYEAALIEQMPSLFLDYGITSVRDTGALLAKITPEVQRWLKLGDEAPDLYFSGPLLDGALVVYDGNGRTEIGTSVSSFEAATRSVAVLKDAGASFIKIYELVDPDIFKALIAAANSHKLPIAAHVPLSMTARSAGPAVDSMEHLRNIDLDCADNADELHQKRTAELHADHGRSGYELRSHLHATQRAVAYETANSASDQCGQVIDSLVNTIQVPTLRLNTLDRYSPLLRSDWLEHLGRLPDDLAAKWVSTAKYFAGRPSELGTQMSDWSLALVREMQRRGVPIGAGTDTPIGQAIPGYSLHTELERLVDAGLTPQEALGSATIQPALFFRQQDQRGEIRAGMEADLVLLRKHPLEDIRNTRSIAAVISNGQRVW